MTPMSELVYWDSCCFLEWLLGPNPVHHEREPLLMAVMAEVDAGHVELMTSMITIAEVAYVAYEKPNNFSDETLAKIDALWMPKSGVRVVDCDRVIAKLARTLQRKAAIANVERFHPYDAIHIATAMQHGAVELQTFDEFPNNNRTVKQRAVLATLFDYPLVSPRAVQMALPFAGPAVGALPPVDETPAALATVTAAVEAAAATVKAHEEAAPLTADAELKPAEPSPPSAQTLGEGAADA